MMDLVAGELFAGRGGGTRLRSTRSWNPVQQAYAHPDSLRGHHGAITAVCFSQDAQRCVSTSEDCYVMVWCTDTGVRLGEFVFDGGCLTCDIRSDNALFVCGDTTGKLCVLRVIEKAPGSVLLEKTLRMEYSKAQRNKELKTFGKAKAGASASPNDAASELSALVIDTSKIDKSNKSQRNKKGPRKRTEKQRGRAKGSGNMSMVQLCAWYTTTVAGQLHDIWRSNRLLADNTYDPRIKHICGHPYDIANLNFDELPERYKIENKMAATVACNDVFSAIINGKKLNEAFLYRASCNQHKEWLRRNGAWAPESQKVPFHKLSDEDKEKDEVIVKRVMIPFLRS